MSFTHASYAFKNSSHSGTPISVALAVVVDVGADGAGEAVFVAVLVLVVSDFEQPMSKRADTTKAIRRICFVLFIT